jgi:hypothetical protein
MPTTQERENICTLSNAVIRGADSNLPEEAIAELYVVMVSGLEAYGSDCLELAELYDHPTSRREGAGLILKANFQPEQGGIVSEDLPEGCSVLHKTFGVGNVTLNRTIRTDSPANSCWGCGEDIRIIWVDFYGEARQMPVDETYLTIFLDPLRLDLRPNVKGPNEARR